MTGRSWPETLWLVRHGESAGNVARDAADAAGAEVIAIDGRDVDVPLSPRGEQQADALGRWFGARPIAERPTVVLSSPYVRATQTSTRVVAAGALEEHPQFVTTVDERLREKEFGSFNRLTRAGIRVRFPAEAELYSAIGKFYYRPPGGESWCDVILRLRSVMDHIQLQYAGERVLVVAHQVIVLCFRYLLERLDEAQLLAIDRAGDVANCSVTEYGLADSAGGRSELRLARYNFVAPLVLEGAPITATRDASGGAR